MFQDFRRRTTPETGAPRTAALRVALAAQGLDGVLVPRADAHQGENVAPCDERLAWLTGFTGSAGLAVIARERAAVFVDGRYRLQVRAETDPAVFEPMRHPEDKPADWIAAALPGGGRIGYDPWLHTRDEIDTLATALGPRQIALVPVANPVDAVWTDRPPAPARPILPHPDALAGRSSADKRADLARGLADAGVVAAVLTLLESVAWLLNIRGSDIARTPVPRAFAILHATGAAELFAAPEQAGDALRAHLGPDVTLHPRDAFGPRLDALTGRIAVDRTRAPVWVSDRLAAGAAEVAWTEDPCLLPKATKTLAEIAGARAAHLRDGAAMATFLAWLARTAPAGGLTEIAVVRELEAIRTATASATSTTTATSTGALRDIAFDTICGSGPNGAIVHYRVTETSDRAIAPGELLLVDSGGQYPDGTTDVTRTVAIGPAPAEARRPFTLVLKGLIAMSRLTWPDLPAGLAGRDLDAVARVALWRAGLDYDHGTGHGVGSYLGVHEGPQGLSRRATAPIRPGMILSIEPGYYREGAFGIRTENLAVVAPPQVPPGGERAMLGFETLTLAPIDRSLVDPALLDPDETAWLDAYHARVAEALGPLVQPDTAAWLATACRPLNTPA